MVELVSQSANLTLTSDGQLTIAATLTPQAQADHTHEGNHKCILPVDRGITPANPFPPGTPGVPTPGKEGPEQTGLWGWYGKPLHVPSVVQTRTTKNPRNKAHPANRNRPQPWDPGYIPPPPTYEADLNLSGGGQLVIASSVPPPSIAFDAMSKSAYSSAPLGLTHPTADDATDALVAVSYWSGAGTNPVVTFDGVTMDLTVPVFSAPNVSLAICTLHGPHTGGTKPVVVTNGGYVSAICVTYRHTNGFGAHNTASGGSEDPAMTVPSAADGRWIVQAFAGADATLASYNQNERGNVPFTSGQNEALLVGDAPGAASVPFTATHPGGDGWCGAAIQLLKGT